MIPKIVHYCWFGGKQKPPDVLAYIEDWKRVLPDYEIREWNEENFRVSDWPYAQQALDAGKFAFVSDVARLYALHSDGGVYLDTDVEVRRSFDDLLGYDVVLGFEEGHYIATSTILARPNSKLIGEFLDGYRTRSFGQNGSFDLTTNVQVLTSLLESNGLKCDGANQSIEWKGERIHVLDRVVLSPIDYLNGINHTGDRTFAVHHFGQTWASGYTKLKSLFRRWVIGLIGVKNFRNLRMIAFSLHGRPFLRKKTNKW
ncbi:glycosyltransferase family 32 protein [Halomonas alimentaria]|uniref:glycosyltransferase family 32 protein n=1 Tax=Halomonas alimentaria TaxID=147248 RepID=UPI0024923AE0|nr:glycosyltransferase [Halomonas alimentaria]